MQRDAYKQTHDCLTWTIAIHIVHSCAPMRPRDDDDMMWCMGGTDNALGDAK